MGMMDTIKDLAGKWKTISDYEEEAKAKPTKGPLALTKEQKEATQLKNERARNPKEFDAAKAMYDSALQQNAEGKKKGGCVKMAKGGYVKAADGIAQRGRTKGRIV